MENRPTCVIRKYGSILDPFPNSVAELPLVCVLDLDIL